MKKYKSLLAILSLALIFTSCDQKGGDIRALMNVENSGNHHHPTNRAVHHQIIPQTFEDSLVGTTWVTSPINELSSKWHVGGTTPKLSLITFISNNEVIGYNEVQLGGTTHQVPAYVDPPFNQAALDSLVQKPKKQHFTYDPTTHMLNIYASDTAHFNPATTLVDTRLEYVPSVTDPTLKLYAETYHVTPNTLANLTGSQNLRKSMVGTTWLLNVTKENVNNEWHVGSTSPNVRMLAFVSEHEVWAYSDLQLGGNTQVKDYVDPPFNPITLKTISPAITRYYYDYDRTNHVVKTYEVTPELYNPATSPEYYKLYFNNDLDNPVFRVFTTVHYYMTGQGIPQSVLANMNNTVAPISSGSGTSTPPASTPGSTATPLPAVAPVTPTSPVIAPPSTPLPAHTAWTSQPTHYTQSHWGIFTNIEVIYFDTDVSQVYIYSPRESGLSSFVDPPFDNLMKTDFDNAATRWNPSPNRHPVTYDGTTHKGTIYTMEGSSHVLATFTIHFNGGGSAIDIDFKRNFSGLSGTYHITPNSVPNL